MQIDRESIVPIYLQVRDELRESIENQLYQDGDRLPSERELCEQYGVSRMTIRQTIGELEREGIVRRHHGKGTFVMRKKLDQPLLKLTSFSEDMRARGLTPGARTLALEVTAANSYIADKLALKVGDDVVMLKRLRTANEQPMAIESCYLSHTLCKPILQELSNNQSLYRLMKENLRLLLDCATQTIEVGSIQGWEASLLEVPDNASVLLMKRQTFASNGKPVEYVESKYRGDCYRFNIELYEL